MALLALPISQKSPWDKFLGERLRALIGTLGGAALLVAGVTTLGSCDEFRDSLTGQGLDSPLFVTLFDKCAWLKMSARVGLVPHVVYFLRP
jgi:hypothetical protein